jgi:hypothetical protein
MFIHHRAGTVQPVLRPHLQGAQSHPIFIKETLQCKLKDFPYAADCPCAHLQCDTDAGLLVLNAVSLGEWFPTF